MYASYVNGRVVLFTVFTYTEKLIFFKMILFPQKCKIHTVLVCKIYFTHDQAASLSKITTRIRTIF